MDAALTPRFTHEARVEQIMRGYRLWIPSGKNDSYRLAQLDNYAALKRSRFPAHPPLTLSLRARASSDSIPGTWGFGLWNDPFGLSLGFGGSPFRLPALPNTVWFFHASKENYLSFIDIGGRVMAPDLDMDVVLLDHQRHVSRPPAANGFLAQTFRSPKFDLRLILAGLTLPFSRKAARRWLSRIIDEDGIDLRSSRFLATSALKNASYAETLSVDPTQWHGYKLEWREKRVVFYVDDDQVFETSASPHPPLGLVIWIDNQYAAFTPEGKIGFGVLSNPEPAWIEIQDIEITSDASIA